MFTVWWQKLNIITSIIPTLCTLISNVKDFTVCSGFWESIHVSQSTRKSCIVVMVIFYCSEKILKICKKKNLTFVYRKGNESP